MLRYHAQLALFLNVAASVSEIVTRYIYKFFAKTNEHTEKIDLEKTLKTPASKNNIFWNKTLIRKKLSKITILFFITARSLYCRKVRHLSFNAYVTSFFRLQPRAALYCSRQCEVWWKRKLKLTTKESHTTNKDADPKTAQAKHQNHKKWATTWGPELDLDNIARTSSATQFFIRSFNLTKLTQRNGEGQKFFSHHLIAQSAVRLVINKCSNFIFPHYEKVGQPSALFDGTNFCCSFLENTQSDDPRRLHNLSLRSLLFFSPAANIGKTWQHGDVERVVSCTLTISLTCSLG